MRRTAREPAASYQAGLVLDASVTMSWFFPDEASAFSEQVLELLGTQAIWVPALWTSECANVLQSATRKSRLGAARRAEIARELAELPVTLDFEPPSIVQLDQLAAAHALSAYDATYLELARRRKLPLATLDLPLRRAARAAGVPLASVEDAG